MASVRPGTGIYSVVPRVGCAGAVMGGFRLTLFKPTMYLFFDTETTGIIERNRPAESSGQPETVQLAAKLVTEEKELRASLNVLIEPSGWEIPAGAAKVHGISTQTATEAGVPRRVAMALFSNLCRKATYAVAHGFDFDHTVVSAALWREKAQNRLNDLIPVCTMKAAAPILKIPKPFKGKANDPWKWPKLNEAYAHYFNGATFDGAHDAMVDVDAMIACFWEMRELGHLPDLYQDMRKAA